MNIRRASDGVFETDEEIIRVTGELIDVLRKEAPATLRQRIRFNAHRDPGEMVQEMIIALAHDTYIPPHKHLGKPESFHLIEGLLDIVIFDEEGEIRDLIQMGDCSSGMTFYYRNDAPIYHSVVAKSEVVIFHETTRGPFVPGETIFPRWAPSSETEESVLYLAKLRKRIDQFLITRPAVNPT